MQREFLTVNNTLIVGFKGKNNTSSMLVEQLLSDNLLLTNSFAGLKKDIDSISGEYDQIVMFGVDKELTSGVRIERVAAKDGVKYFTKLNLERIQESLNSVGVTSIIAENPTTYLCNEAYWYMLKKFEGRAVFIHVPTMKNLDEDFFQSMKQANFKR